MSGDTLQQAKEFSRSLHGSAGSVLLETINAVGRSEIASTADGDEAVHIVDEALETNLNAYLQAVCAGGERPASSHPMRLAKALVIGALRDKQSDFLNVGRCVADLPDGSVSQDASLRNAKKTMKRWRDFIIYLATLVASVFEPMRFDACIQEICAVSDEGLPGESCWRRALNYVTLTAARFQFIRLLVLPVELHDKCIGKCIEAPPVPISVKTVPYMIWSDSNLAAKPYKVEGVRKSPKSTMVPDYLKTVKLHHILAKMTHDGGKLVDMLKWVEDILATSGPQSCLFVGVWSFNDFFKGNNNVIYHLPDEFFVNLNRFIECLNTLFPKSVMICGGAGKTWDVQDTVFDIHSARSESAFDRAVFLLSTLPTCSTPSLKGMETPGIFVASVITTGRGTSTLPILHCSVSRNSSHMLS